MTREKMKSIRSKPDWDVWAVLVVVATTLACFSCNIVAKQTGIRVFDWIASALFVLVFVETVLILYLDDGS